MNPDDLQPQTREEHYCEEHEMIHIKNAIGQFVCPFCASSVSYDQEPEELVDEVMVNTGKTWGKYTTRLFVNIVKHLDRRYR